MLTRTETLSTIFQHGTLKNGTSQLRLVSTRPEGYKGNAMNRRFIRTTIPIKARLLRISKPSSQGGAFQGTSLGPSPNEAPFDSWHTKEIPGPDIGDKETVVNLAKMCSDAYLEAPHRPDWLNTSLGFNHSDTFGWKADGLRGHVFTDKMNETVIIAFKGTSIG
jgi:putative lipase involved disintegration of autophagic bodies